MKTIAMILAAVIPSVQFAATWYVDGTNGSDDNPGTSQDKAKATIQATIDASAEKDIILVGPGTYSAIKTDNKDITIQSAGGASQTIIDGGGTNRCAWMAIDTGDENWSTNRWSTKLIGFTLANGYARDYGEERGDGAAIVGGTTSGCIIRDCYGERNIVFAEEISNSLIIGNISPWAIMTHGGARNCTIVSNDSAYCIWDHGQYNCIVQGNVYTSYGEPNGCHNCCLETELAPEQGNFVADPKFVDAAHGDYRLAADSPCIDAGDNSYVVGDTDLDGCGRIVNGTVDIGCYEFEPDGGPYVEKVGETNWTYMIKNGRASVGDGANAAIDTTIADAVNVPTRLRTRPVVAIDDNALQGCTNMTSVTIPASVKAIGESAFEGCGRLADVYFEGATMSSIGVDAFRGCYWDLIMHVPTTWQGRGRTICGYTVWKGDDPNEVVRVVSTNVVVHYMTTNTPVEVVAPILADTGIVNVMTEVKGGNVAIPDSWAKGFATFETKFGSNFTDALTRQTGKYDCNNTPMLVWQDYVAGTDPTNPDDTFTATITMVEGVPQVAWKPVLTEEAAAKRVYRKFGKVKLTDEWAEIPSGHEADYNFFKVTVEMK